jgi:hypothetical protein
MVQILRILTTHKIFYTLHYIQCMVKTKYEKNYRYVLKNTETLYLVLVDIFSEKKKMESLILKNWEKIFLIY